LKTNSIETLFVKDNPVGKEYQLKLNLGLAGQHDLTSLVKFRLKLGKENRNEFFGSL
jgi:hypothetical protein